MINSLPTDFLIRIKNAYLAGKTDLSTPYSDFCLNISKLLKDNQLIIDYSVVGEKKKTLNVKLVPTVAGSPLISQVTILSKPGRRYYEKSTSLPWGRSKKSIIIVSTSSGLMTQRQAKSKGLGGEIIAEIN